MTEQRDFLDQIAEATANDSRLLGLLVGGSYASKTMDLYSDLDCILVVDDDAYDAVLGDRKIIAAAIGPLLHCFSGDFLGEPRLLICLYQEPLLHVDYKVVTPAMLADRVEDPVIVWQRDRRIRAVLESTAAHWPRQTSEWFDEHFWIWLHYGATKLARGELFEALDILAMIRKRIFGPLLTERAGERQYELRHIERLGPEAIAMLADITPRPDRIACKKAPARAIDHYATLSQSPMPTAAADAVTRYLENIP